MVSTMGQPGVFEISGLVARKGAAGRIALPVSRAVVLYSRYKHVRGMVSPDPSRGVSLAKLRALDSLIDRLVRLHGTQPLVRNAKGLRKHEVDGLIASYRKGVHRIVSNPAKSSVAGSAVLDSALSLNVIA